MIYVIRTKNNGPIKIGATGDLVDRMGVLKQGNPYSFDLLVVLEGGREFESELHRRYSDIKIRGEWFLPSNVAIEQLKELADRDCVCDEYTVKVSDNIYDNMVRCAVRRLEANRSR